MEHWPLFWSRIWNTDLCFEVAYGTLTLFWSRKWSTDLCFEVAHGTLTFVLKSHMEHWWIGSACTVLMWRLSSLSTELSKLHFSHMNRSVLWIFILQHTVRCLYRVVRKLCPMNCWSAKIHCTGMTKKGNYNLRMKEKQRFLKIPILRNKDIHR